MTIPAGHHPGRPPPLLFNSFHPVGSNDGAVPLGAEFLAEDWVNQLNQILANNNVLVRAYPANVLMT